MGILADPLITGVSPRRRTGFFAEVFLYPCAKGSPDDHGTAPDDCPPPADAPGPPTRRSERAHPGGLPSRGPPTRRPLPHTTRPPQRAASPRLLPSPQERPQVRRLLDGNRLQRHQV